MKRIGIVGGLGPEPTIEYYRTIINTYRQQGETKDTPEIIIVSLNLQDFIQMMESGQKAIIIGWLAQAVQDLRGAGADFALIAAGTPHIFFGEIARLSPIPLLSVVEETCNLITKVGLKRIGLFGTKFTMQSDLYQRVFSKSHVSVFVPPQEDQVLIHGKLIEELQFGHVIDETRKELLSIVKKMIKTHSIQGLILGCTELPLILPKEGFGIPFFNTTKIHAESAVQYCLLDDKRGDI